MRPRANIAYIGTAVSTALAREIETPTIPAEAKRRADNTQALTLVSGFVVKDDSQAAAEQVIEDARLERRRKIDAFHVHRDQISQKATDLGVELLAILPTSVWDRICMRSKLYQLAPGADAKVWVDTSRIMKRFNRMGTLLNVCLWLGFLALVPLAAVWIGGVTRTTDIVGVSLFSTIITAVIGGFVCSMVLDGKPYIRTHSQLVRLQMWLYRFKPHAMKLRDYFPGGVSPKYSDTKATLVLPIPPKEVADKLLKVRSLNLRVAAVGEAIGFMETPAQIMRDEHTHQIKLREELWAARLRPDPFIYHVHESAVAIIAQFGDFPIEKRVVDEIVHSEHLL